ncbi:alcohol dehydrogenase catalytic domain-containing protein [uncultured Maribacter sp.]|uniref:zinc-dependent alcohol dehydrogenase n=1 Tax=uncultured Maribacter sp. TaxID=431308 RepID=UPI0030D7BAB6|tara:strand:+ start:709 stop:1698 length:990 start_codon:yes stop_codon:yes gene_type:complete
MNAAFLETPKTIQQKTVSTPDPVKGEVRVKMRQVGICGSDVHLFLGHRTLEKPTIIGHEGLGEIDAVGNGVPTNRIGERVVIEPNIPCGACAFCTSARGSICPNKRTIGLTEAGCFAEYVVLPSQFAWAISKKVSDDDAVTIEPMAAGVHALQVSSAKPGSTIAVIGLGAIGLLLTHLAIAKGYKVCVSDINTDKMKLAESMGALPAVGQNLSQIWKENNVVSIFECAGVATTVTMAAKNAPRGSEIILLGLSGDKAEIEPLRLVREGIRILPSLIYDHPQDFKETIALITSKTIQPSCIISKYMPLSSLQSAMELAAEGNQTKIVINI